MEIKFHATARQVLDLSEAAKRRIGWPRASRTFAIAALMAWIVIVIAVMQLATHYGGRPIGVGIAPDGIAILALSVGAVAAMVFCFGQAAVYGRAYAQAGFRQGGSYIGERTLTLTNDGIQIVGAHGHSLTTWPTITDVSEYGETVLIWTDPSVAITVPKTAFATDAARRAFIAEIARYIHEPLPDVKQS